MTSRFFLFLFIVAAVIGLAVFAILTLGSPGGPGDVASSPGQTGATETQPTAQTTGPEDTLSPSPETPAALPEDLAPAATEKTKPSEIDLKTGIMAADKQVDSYERTDKISFPLAKDYTALEGVTTFRGDNYRTGASYGTANVAEKELEVVWDYDIGAIDGWSGVCWTGQPLIVKWPEAAKNNMNIKDSKKDKTDLKEVILPTADGHVYFLDLDDGVTTRKSIDIGVPVKGTASIDPRGYPILYTGQAVNEVNGKSVSVYFRIYSLIDGKLLTKFGGKDPFSYRSWQAYDSSPLIDAFSDTLVTGGENGILYTMKLNTEYDEEKGTLSMDPEGRVKYRYTRPGYANDDKQSLKRWYGIENSIVGWRNYAFFTDNGGTLQCVDLNSMKPVYAIDVTDDSDATMVLEEDIPNNTFYLYTANEVDKQKNAKANKKGKAYHRKINGLTGEIIREHEYTAYTSSSPTGNNGGTLASPLFGREGSDIDDLIVYAMDMVPVKLGGSDDTVSGGRLIAYRRDTFEEAWRVETKGGYWSSPIAVYDEEGKAYIVACERDGYGEEGKNGCVRLYDAGGNQLGDPLVLKGDIDASPAAYGDMIVLGTRGRKIYGIRIK